ncbi:MAG TPA: D-alanine--D-alanine ligase [Candidatus Krumholzibacteria bacterium]|nr:D-alanine--D-alanine ligase [Candidatus Krumholzibacteria bacterium]
MKKLRVLVLVHEDLVPPESLEGHTEKEIALWRTEYDVCHALRGLGHEVHVLGVQTDLGAIRVAIEEKRPHIAFNLLEEFHGVAMYDQHVASYLELMKIPYTGCNPRGLMLSHDKALCRKVLAYHRVPGPRFQVFPMNRRTRLSKRMRFPLFVKSAVEDASFGISQASVVTDEAHLRARVEFVHERIGTDALVEGFVDGREMYVSVLGNERLQAFPVLEMDFGRMPEGSYRIASHKIKWDTEYQDRVDVTVDRAQDLEPAVERRIFRLAKRVYRMLGMSGFARIDLRLDPGDVPHVIEVNANPDLAADDLFAESALLAGVAYDTLIARIVSLGRRYRAQWRTS